MNASGFTLIEIIVAIALIAILATAITPVVYQKINAEREQATRMEMVAIYEAATGDVKNNNHGYVGDMGALPSTLADLNTNPGATSNSAETCGVGIGWGGPYVISGFDSDDYLTDAWGTNYVWNSPSVGQITSYGADGASGGGDDMTYPEDAFTVIGTLTVTVTANDISDPSSSVNLDDDTAQVTVYYSSSGSESSTSATWNATDQYFSVSAHHGIHCIKAEGLNGPQTGSPDPDDFSGRVGYRAVWAYGGRTTSKNVHVQ